MKDQSSSFASASTNPCGIPSSVSNSEIAFADSGSKSAICSLVCAGFSAEMFLDSYKISGSSVVLEARRDAPKHVNRYQRSTACLHFPTPQTDCSTSLQGG